MKKLSLIFLVLGVAHGAAAQQATSNTYYSPTNTLSQPPATKPLVITPQERARSEERQTQDKAHVPSPRGMPIADAPPPSPRAPAGLPANEAPPPPPGTQRGDAPPLPPGAAPGDPIPPHRAPRASDALSPSSRP